MEHYKTALLLGLAVAGVWAGTLVGAAPGMGVGPQDRPFQDNRARFLLFYGDPQRRTAVEVDLEVLESLQTEELDFLLHDLENWARFTRANGIQQDPPHLLRRYEYGNAAAN